MPPTTPPTSADTKAFGDSISLKKRFAINRDTKSTIENKTDLVTKFCIKLELLCVDNYTCNALCHEDYK